METKARHRIFDVKTNTLPSRLNCHNKPSLSLILKTLFQYIQGGDGTIYIFSVESKSHFVVLRLTWLPTLSFSWSKGHIYSIKTSSSRFLSLGVSVQKMKWLQELERGSGGDGEPELLSWGPYTYNPDVFARACNPITEDWRQIDSRGLLAGWSKWNIIIWAQ